MTNPIDVRNTVSLSELMTASTETAANDTFKVALHAVTQFLYAVGLKDAAALVLKDSPTLFNAPDRTVHNHDALRELRHHLEPLPLLDNEENEERDYFIPHFGASDVDKASCPDISSASTYVDPALAACSGTSEIYTPKARGAPDDGLLDEYRDDRDVGYRVRDVWAVDLLAELEAREQGNTLQVPYVPAFVCTANDQHMFMTGKGFFSRTGAIFLADSSEDQITPTTINSDSLSTFLHPAFKIDERTFHSNTTDASALPLSCRVRPSTPLRVQSSATSRLSSESVLQRTVTGCAGLTSSVMTPGESSVISRYPLYDNCSARGVSEVSGACSSPVFGSSAASVVHGDDELAWTAPCKPVLNQQGELPAKHVDSPLYYAPFDELAMLSPPIERNTNIPTSYNAEENPPVYQVASELCESYEVQQSSDVRNVLSPKSPVFGEADAADIDSAFSESTTGDNNGFESAANPFTQNIESHFLVLELDEKRWTEAYSNGDSHQHRLQKKAEKLERLRFIGYPGSDDPRFPLLEPSGDVIDCFNLKVIFERSRTGFEDSKVFKVITGMVVAGRYVVEAHIGEAAFSKALQCYDKVLNRRVCIKVVRNNKDFVDQCLDEIKLLRYIKHNGDVDKFHCIKLYDFFYYKEHLIIVTELLRENLFEFSWKCLSENKRYFTIGRVQRVAYQVLRALEYVHSLFLLHSDLKPENILIKNEATCEVKVIDFGSSCFADDVLSLYAQSRSYRAPEVLLGLPYDEKIDMWSLGCILAELWTGYVLFHNTSVPTLLARIVGIIGMIPSYMIYRSQNAPDHFTPDGQLFDMRPNEPCCSRRGKRIHLLLPKRSSLAQRMRTEDKEFLEFLTLLLKIDPVQRPSATEALRHPWLRPGRYSDGLQAC